MVAVPAHAAADVEQQPGHVEQHGGDLVGDHLGGVEVACVEAEQHVAPAGRVAQVELVRADHVALGAEAKEFGLDRVVAEPAVNLGGHDRVERLAQQAARGEPVDRGVLEAVGDPDIAHAGRAERAAEVLGDAPAGDAVLDPEAAHVGVGAGQGEAVLRERVREAGRVEVHAAPGRLRPVDPAGEVLGAELVALDLLAARLGVDRVQVQAVRAGDERVGLVEVRAQLVGVARLARIVARGRDPAGELAAGVLEAADVVALPAVQADLGCGQGGQGRLGVDAEGGVALAGQGVGVRDLALARGCEGHGRSSVATARDTCARPLRRPRRPGRAGRGR